MPIVGGNYEPDDAVDAVNMGHSVEEALPVNLDTNESPSGPEVAALARRDWPTTYAGRFLSDLADPSDPNWKQPWDQLEPKYYPYKNFFEDADSPTKWYKAKGYADQEIQDNQLMQDMSLGDWSYYMGVSMADPITILLTLSTMGFGVMGKGLTMTQAAGRTALLAGAESAAIEGVLQLTDPMREIDDSIVSILAGGVAGAFIGAGGQKIYNVVTSKANDPVRKEITRLVREEVKLARAENTPEAPVPVARTAADEVPIDNDEVVGVVDEIVEEIINPGDEKPLWTPFKYLIHNRVTRSAQTILQYNNVAPAFGRLADTLGANNILKKGDYNKTRYNGKTLNEEIKKTERRAFKTMSDGAMVASKTLKKRGIKMSVDDVAVQAGKAARKGAVREDFETEVWNLGRQFRKEMDDWKERGVLTKVLKDHTEEIEKLDVRITKLRAKDETPANNKKIRELEDQRSSYLKAMNDMEDYVPRFWDMDRVSNYPDKFRRTIKTWARNKYHEDPLSEGELDDLVDDIKDTLNRISKGETHPMRFHVQRKDPKSGHLKSRRIDADDIDLDFFLNSDVRVLADRYVRTAGADIIARELFGVDNILDLNGVPMRKDLFNQGIEEFNAALRALEPSVDKGSKLAKLKYRRLEAKRELTINAAEDYLRAIMRRPKPPTKEVYRKVGRYSDGVRGYTAAAGLGGVVESAFPDAANNVLQHGMVNMLASLPQFFKALPAIFSRGPIKNAAASHWREMDVALDMLMSNRMMAVADINDVTRMGVKTGFFHGTEIARKAFRVFQADRWNTAAKILAATSAERRILKDAARMARGKLGKHRSAKMHRIGMTQEIAERITANHRRAGKSNGVVNIGDWDEATASQMKRMLFRESEFQVVAPDAGEMPELFDNPIGKLFMQFKTFIISHTMKQLMPASQRFVAGDMSVLAGIATMGGLSIFSRYVKDVTKSFDKDVGFDIDKVNEEWSNKTVADLAAIAIEHGAILSYLPSLLGQLDNAMNNELGESVGMTPRKAFYSPGLGVEGWAAGLGYMGNAADAAIQGARTALPEDLGYSEYTAKDLNKVRRSIPLQNTFYLQWLFDWVEQFIVEGANLPENSRKKDSKGRM